MSDQISLTDMEGLLALMEQVNSLITNYKQNTVKMVEIHKKLLCVPWGQISQDLNIQLNTIDRGNKRITRNVRDKIKQGYKMDVAQVSVKEEKLSSAAEWLHNAMMEYNNEQIQYNDKAKEKLVKAIQITGAEMSHDQILHKIDSGEMGAVFTAGIIRDTAEASRQLEEVHNRHKEVVKLEDSLRELAELMEEIQELVAGQKEKIDHVKVKVDNAELSVKTAATILERAAKLKKKLMERRMVVWIAASSFVILFIMILAIALRSSDDTESTTTPPVTTPTTSTLSTTVTKVTTPGSVCSCPLLWAGSPCHPPCD